MSNFPSQNKQKLLKLNPYIDYITFIGGTFVEYFKNVMKKKNSINKNIFLILISIIAVTLFLNIVKVKELSCYGSENINNDKNLENCEYFSIDYNSNLIGIKHVNSEKLGPVFSIYENENSYKKLSPGTISKFFPIDFADSDIKLFQERNSKFLKSLLPELQTSKALRSEILLI